MVTAAAPELPQTLLDQLKVGGIMVLPVDIPGRPREQKLVRVTRTETGIAREDLMDVRFVPLVEGVARES